ncbi:MAG: L,D-transpeptidase family protein [Candidatus Sericytochromatia bacterium]
MLKSKIFFISLFFMNMSFCQTNNQSSQLITVVSKNWNDFQAELKLYEKNSVNDDWHLVSQPMKAVIGKNGMKWGRGLHKDEDILEKVFRQEGDKTAPAGIFSLSSVFGIEDVNKIKEENLVKLPYLYLTDSMRCVGEQKSKYYNEIVDAEKVEKDWENDENNEKMRYEAIRDEQAYKWGVVVDHNVGTNKDKKSGSCIFIHLWKSYENGTSGCTALEEKDVKKIIHWLDPKKNPLLIQLPQSEYERLKNKWKLPSN